MTSAEDEGRQAGLGNVVILFTLQSAAIGAAELRKLMRDPAEIFSRAVQPILWLAVFGRFLATSAASPRETSGISIS